MAKNYVQGKEKFCWVRRGPGIILLGQILIFINLYIVYNFFQNLGGHGPPWSNDSSVPALMREGSCDSPKSLC